MPTGTVYQLFGSKRDLLLASMDALLAHLEQFGPPRFADTQTLPADLEKFLEDVFARELPFRGVYRAWQEAALIDRTIAMQDRRIRSWTRTRIRNLFAILAGIPGARPGLNTALLAELWDRFFWNLLADPSSDRKGAVRSIAETLYRTLFFNSSDGALPIREAGRRNHTGTASDRKAR